MGTWRDNAGLLRKFGLTKVVPTPGGDYKTFGDVREIEFDLDLTTLTTTQTMISAVIFIGANMFIEEVTVDTEVAATGGTSFSVGTLSYTDGATVNSNTTFLSAAPIADHNAAGARKTYIPGVTGVGGSVGTTVSTTLPYYIGALATGTYTAGKVKIRIKYRGFGTITQ